jgi:2-polyprenyl-3-methyl-5-hydroxy-6-metoxy-1,4-benzoquinol methylase
MGLLAFYLHERGFRPPVLGIDVDEKKIARGARIAARHYPSVTLQVTDGGSLPEFLGHVTMLDVLHYLPPAQQKSTLQEMARRVAPGGWCVIRTTPRDGGWRFRCTLALEKFARSIAWMTRSAIEFPTIESVRAEFPETEFSSEIRPLWGRTPFNSWLLAFRRRN